MNPLSTVVRTLSSHMGRHITTIIAAADPDTELSKAFRNHFILSRRDEGRVLLQQAAEAGEIRPDADLEIVLDQTYGALFFRLLMGHAPLDAGLARAPRAASASPQRVRHGTRRPQSVRVSVG